MQSAKLNIKKVVAEYIKVFPQEYELFKDAMDYKKSNKVNKWSQVSENMRGLYEMPETLSGMLTHNLTDDQLLWLKQGGSEGHEGGRWFAKTFPIFALNDE